MKDAATIAIVLIVCVAFVIGFIGGFSIAEGRYQSDAIQRGFAQYNPTNGVWMWKEGK